MTDHASALRPRPMCNGARTSVARLGRPLAAALALWALSAAAVNVDAPNRAPLADAGAPQTALVGQRVALDAGASSDADGDRLSYHWTLVSTPRGSAARLRDPHALRPQFDIDLLGDYVAELVVSDGVRDSAPRHVVVSTGNAAPVAVAPPGGTLARGDAIVLSSAASYDADGDALSARWSLIEQPASGRASLRRHGAGSALLQANASGDYLLQLIVNDGRQDSAPVQVRYSTVESAPLADAGDDRVSILGARLRLNGSRSLDSDGDALGYRWALLHAPAGSAAGLSATDTPHPTLAVDVAGLYVAQLIVSDAGHDSAADTVVIEARAPGGGALVELSQLTGQLDHSGPSRGGGSDVDGDGIPDLTDNCVEVFNPDQRDTNGDGFGNICDPDLDNDGFITNTVDLGLLRAAFFSSPGDANWNPDADFDGDGAINTTELGIIKSYFFGPPGPIAINFINPAGGSWHDANNWSLGVVPTTVHSVRISLAPGVVVTYSSGSTEIASLRAFSDFTLAGGNLSVVGSMQVNAPFTVSGGTLANATIGAPLTSDIIQVTGTSTFDGVTLAQDMTINNARILTINNNLTLSGNTVTLASSASGTFLNFAGAANTLGGSGEVVFGGTVTGDTANDLRSNGTGPLTIGPGITVRSGTSGGVVRTFSQPLIFQGMLISDLPGRTVSLLPGGGSSLEGSFVASGGAHLAIDGTAAAYAIAATATINVSDGNLDLFGGWVNEGTIQVTNGEFDTGNTNTEEWDNNGVITLTNTPTELGGRFTAADIGTFNTSGDVLLNGVLDNIGQSLDTATLPGNLLLGGGGRVIGGTLFGTPLLVSGTFALDGVTLAADLTINNSSFLTIDNSLTLSGSTVTLASAGSTTLLSFAGSASTLAGTGEVVFAGTTTSNTANDVRANGAGTLTIEPGITIRSGTAGGIVRTFTQSLIYQGTLLSNVAGRTVTVTFGGGTSLEGTFTASGGGNLVIDGNAAPYAITASANISVTDGDLDLFGAWVNAGSIQVTNGVFDTGNINTEAWINNGVITLTNAAVELGGLISPTGLGSFNTSGDVLLNGVLDNTGQTLDTATLPGNLLLGGNGTILGGTLIGAPLNATGTFALDGVTLAADLTINNGVFLTINNSLTLSGSTVTLASTGSTTLLSFAGAGSTLGGNGEVVFGGSTTSNTANDVRSNGAGSLTIGPAITVRTGTAGGILRTFTQPLNIQGALVSDLSGRTLSATFGGGGILAGTFTASGGGNLAFDGNATPYTFTSGATIDVSDGNLDLFGAWVNEGTIQVSNGELDTGNINTEIWDNNGVITLTNTVTELSGRITAANIGTFNTSGDVLLNGVLDNSGMSLDTGTLPGNILLTGNGTILGGTLVVTPVNVTGAFTFDGVIAASDLTINNSVFLTIRNNLTLNGTATLASTGSTTSLSFAGGSNVLDGTGEVVFGGTTGSDAANEMRNSSGGLTIGPGITVRTGATGGFVRTFSQPLDFEGTLISDLPSRSVTVTGGALTIDGTVRAGAGAVVAFSDNYSLSATANFEVDIGGLASDSFGRIVAPFETATLAGTLDLNLVNGFTPIVGDTFEVLTFASRTGTFDSETGTDIGGGQALQVNYNATDVTLETVAAP